MRLALPWLDVLVVDAAPALRTEIVRATAKFALETTTAIEAVEVADCSAVGDGDEAVRLRLEANARYQFVWGRIDRRRSTFATADGSVVSIDHDRRRLELRLASAVFTAPYSTWSDLLAAPLAEHWRACGCYPLHAGAVGADGRALLVCGASGSGKTTVTLALVAAGATWRADDKVLLRAAGRREAVSLYGHTNLPPATIARHPSLAFALDRPPIDETNDKRPCALSELPVSVDLSPFRPSGIMFPRRVHDPISTLSALSAGEALLRLSAQSPASPSPDRARGQHAAIVDLVRRLPAWQLSAGCDALEAPAAFAERVWDAVDRRAAVTGS